MIYKQKINNTKLTVKQLGSKVFRAFKYHALWFPFMHSIRCARAQHIPPLQMWNLWLHVIIHNICSLPKNSSWYQPTEDKRTININDGTIH